MTIDELTTVLARAAESVAEHQEVPEHIGTLLRPIAELMHIDEEGFAASDIRSTMRDADAQIATERAWR
jgi:hypothetical protein